MRRYTVGYLFSPDGRRVVLVEKDHPEAQKGKLNGVGGKCEDGPEGLESYDGCMVREFREETGVDVPAEKWLEFGRMQGSDWECALFTATHARYAACKKRTSEDIVIVDVDQVTRARPFPGAILCKVAHPTAGRWVPILPNVPAHVAMALLRMGHPEWFLGSTLRHGKDLGR